MITEVQQQLNSEIEAHRNTKIELTELKNKYALLELLVHDKKTQQLLKRLEAENYDLKISNRMLSNKLAELKGMMLPGVSASGISRAYDHRRKT